MTQYRDRSSAGKFLAGRLETLRIDKPVVLGLPRGGVPVAAEVAAALNAPLDIVVVRKLGSPYNPELAMGAIGEGGVRVLNPRRHRSGSRLEKRTRRRRTRRANRIGTAGASPARGADPGFPPRTHCGDRRRRNGYGRECRGCLPMRAHRGCCRRDRRGPSSLPRSHESDRVLRRSGRLPLRSCPVRRRRCCIRGLSSTQRRRSAVLPRLSAHLSSLSTVQEISENL